MKNLLKLGLAAVSLAALMVAAPLQAGAQQLDFAIKIGGSDLGGVVKSAKGPAADVWVIAETTDLPTKFAKMVVTDDNGRYVLPELPKANYKVWVRGYGLVDSAKVDATPGRVLDLMAVVAPDEKSAADYYPAIYWFAMLGIPKASEFPGTGAQGNGMSTGVKDQGQWLDVIKTDGCYTCHQIGNKATRDIEPMFKAEYKTSAEAWERRIQSGQAMEFMTRMISKIDPSGLSSILPTGLTVSRRVSFPLTSRNVRRGWSATWSSACGTGHVPIPICMIRSPPTSATLR